MPKQTTSASARHQSLFTPFTYEFPQEHFKKLRENNKAEMFDFHSAETIQDKLRVMQSAQITAQNMMINLDGFANDFNRQMHHLHEAFESFAFGFEQLSDLMNDVNTMALKIAEYEIEKTKEIK